MEYGAIRISRLDWKEREFVYGASRISLCQERAGKEGRDYLFCKRGLDVESVAKFRLGYVPFSLDPYSVKPEYRKSVFAFRGRIVFPIFDMYDNLLALSVRPVRDDAVVEQKYWNEAFAKGEHLFGLSLAKYAIARSGVAIVVEGQFDVIKMHSHGLTNTVGVLGGAFTYVHAMLLYRWANQIVFVMDGDKAGLKHEELAEQTMQMYSQGSQRSLCPYTFVRLEEGSDPAVFLSKNGGRAMKKKIVEAMAAANLRIPKQWQKI